MFLDCDETLAVDFLLGEERLAGVLALFLELEGLLLKFLGLGLGLGELLGFVFDEVLALGELFIFSSELLV